MGENTHQNCTRQNKNKEDPGRQQPCWGFLFCTNLTQPTGALDSRTSREVLDFLKELNQEGNTIVIITHDSSIALEAKRVVRIKDGKINFDGDVKEYAAVLSSGDKKYMEQ